MSTKFTPLGKIKTGRDDYKIKVRIIRKWRGMSKQGEDFKNFNILLLDNKNDTIHAFIPTLSAYDLERKIKVGTINIFSNFTVQAYKDTDKFRCVRGDNQLIFSKETKVQQIEETGTIIPSEKFDFYDHSELRPLATETTYMIDVVGIMKDHEVILETITNRHGVQQEQAKFVITDGRSNVNVTFWDKYAQQFVQAVWEKRETPVIIIIAACRVLIWNGEVNLTNVAATKFYFNFDHHSVRQLRQMLSDPAFSKKALGSTKPKIAPLLTIEAIKSLGDDYIQAHVLAHVTITKVDDTQKWYILICTSCDLETQVVDGFFCCTSCPRIVPHPEIRFRLVVLASDVTGTVEVVLHDREIRTILGKRARQILPKNAPATYFPECFKLMIKRPYTLKLEINEFNVRHNGGMYWATNICNGFKLEELEEEEPETSTIQNTAGTSSTTQIPGMSDLNCNSSAITEN